MKLSYLLSCLCWSLLTLTVCGQEPSATVDRSELLLVVGAAGQEDYGRDFGIWADRWQQAAEQGGAAVTVIGRSAAAGGEASVTDRDAILAAITRNAGTASAEPLWRR